MRAILHGFHEAWHEPILSRLLQRLDLRYCELTYADFRPAAPTATELVAHHWAELDWARYPIDENELLPLDEALLVALAETEAIVLKMFDRLDPMRANDYQTRKNLYLRHVRYWNHVLLTQRIDLFLLLNMPHEMFDYVVYGLCRHHGIRTLIGFQLQVPDAILMVEDWRAFSAEIVAPLREAQAALQEVPEDRIELAPRFAREWTAQTATRAPTPFYMHIPAAPAPSLPERAGRVWKRLSSGDLPRRLLDTRAWRGALDHQVRLRERERLSQELVASYERLARTPDLAKKFIYLPLHMQPEMTTSPIAGAYVELPLIAKLVAATMPDDVQLYIKEHPKQLDVGGRYAGYYEELARLPRTTLVPKSFDTFTLLDRCAAVATATGTAGWEALFREKPVLIFGHMYYECATGVFPVRTAAACRAAMQRIFVEGFAPKRKDVKIFMKALERATYDGYLWAVYGTASQVPAERNATTIVDMFCEHILRPAPRTR